MFLENTVLLGYGNVGINRSLYPERSFSKILLSGDFGLVKTFWMYIILLGLFMNIGLVMAPELPIGMLTLLVLMISTLFTLPLHLAMWRAANKYAGSKIWGRLVKLTINIHLFSFVWAILLSIALMNVDDYLSHL